MRNWNPLARFQSAGFSCRLEPTYEELEPQIRTKARQVRREVWSLPMRNWNQSPPPACSGRPCCLEPTYEELELVTNNKDPEKRGSLEPTYEELELYVPQEFSLSNFLGLEPTYEELEPFDAGILTNLASTFGAYL